MGAAPPNFHLHASWKLEANKGTKLHCPDFFTRETRGEIETQRNTHVSF
jgi:hypothetical protein